MIYTLNYYETYADTYEIEADSLAEAKEKLVNDLCIGKENGPDQCIDSGFMDDMREMSVETEAGTLTAYVGPDPENKSVGITLTPKGTFSEIDLAFAEVKGQELQEEEGQVDLYVYGDAFDECYTEKISFKRSDVVEMLQTILDKFYFTFGTDEKYPFGTNDYVLVFADTMAEAHAKFKKRHPDRMPGIMNCAFYYTEEEWNNLSSVKNGVYKKPAEVII